MVKLENGITRSDDSGKYFLESDDSRKYFSENSRKVVKLGKWKSLVIIAGVNLAEIRPLLALTQKWRNLKMGSPEVMIPENTFSKSDDSGEYFSGILVKS